MAPIINVYEFFFLAILLIPTIVAFRKKHTQKIPIVIINVTSLLLFFALIMLGVKFTKEAQMVFTITGTLLFLGSLVWCFITPKNKE
jgi:amino acid transporter